MEVFIHWAIMFLGILGMIQLGELISIWMRRPKHHHPVISVLPLSGAPNNIEQLLGYFQETALWSRNVNWHLSWTVGYLLQAHRNVAAGVRTKAA